MSQNTNLGRVPDDWYSGILYIIDSTVERTPGNPSICANAPWISGDNPYRECDGHWINCKPGDHIVARMWILVDPNYVYTGTEPQYNGGRLGVDLLGIGPTGDLAMLYGHPTSPPLGTETDSHPAQVHWGASGWQLVEWDFIVPSDFYTKDIFSGATIPPTQISKFVFWLDVRPINATGKVWFADGEIYLNPTTTPPAPVQYVVDIWTINGGTTNPTGTQTVNSGSVLSILANPDSTHTFGGWLVNGVSHPATQNPLSVTVTAATTVIPIFNAIQPSMVNLTITVTGQGTTNPAAGNYVNVYKVGDSLNISATPATDWQYQKMKRNGVDWTTANPGGFLNLQATENIEVVFISTATPPAPSQAGMTAFLLPLGIASAIGLVIFWPRGKKRTPRRKQGRTYTKQTMVRERYR